MILSGHQPCYLPGIQLFCKMMHSDAFMHVPHSQYVHGSWHSHNFIRTGRLVVPTHSTLGESIAATKIDNSKHWQRKHLRAIELAYGNQPYFKRYFRDLEEIITHPFTF